MTTEELNTIVQAVVDKINEQVIDFDVVSSTPESTDLLSAVRPQGDGTYQGVTMKWDDVANAVTREAKGYRDEAASAKTNVENMKASVEQTVSDFNTLAEQKKTEVQGVYQTDLNELKGDLNNNYELLSGIATIENFFDKSTILTGYYYNSEGGLTASATSDYSTQFIPVNSEKIYWYLSSLSNAQFLINQYDSSKTCLSRTSFVTNTGELTLSATTKFIRVSIYNDENNVLPSLTISDHAVSATLDYKYAIKDNAVGKSNIKDSSVTRAKIADGVLATADSFYELMLSEPDVVEQSGYYGSNGSFSPSGGYMSYIIPILSDCECYFNNSIDTYISLCVFSSSTISTGTFISPRYRYVQNSEDTIPKENSKLSLSAGQYIAVTFMRSETNISSGFYVDDTGRKSYLADNVYLSNTQLKQVDEQDSSNGFALFHGAVSDNYCGVYLYFKTGYGKLRYDFKKAKDTSRNLESWNIGRLYSVNDDLSEKFSATTGGEWECALSLSGRPDFSGGEAHGNEVVTDLVFFFDGVPYTAQELATAKSLYFRKLIIVEASNLYDPLDNSTLIAKHGKEYTFDQDGLHIQQYVDWKVNDSLGACYLAMLPPSKEYTDMFYSDMDLIPKDSESCYGEYVGIKKATQYSSNNGFMCSMEIEEYPSGYTGSDIFSLRDNTPDHSGGYNKMYFAVCASGSITSGTRWQAKSVYKFHIGEPQ